MTTPQPPATAPAAFYRPESYTPDGSIGLMMRHILTAMGQAVERGLDGPGDPTYPQWIPLYKLRVGAAATVAELARECQLDAGAMTRLLDRLEGKGLVRRERSREDRRVVRLELTPEGRCAVAKVPGVLCRVHNDMLAGFSEAEWAQLKHYLRRMLDNAQRPRAQGDEGDHADGDGAA